MWGYSLVRSDYLAALEQRPTHEAMRAEAEEVWRLRYKLATLEYSRGEESTRFQLALESAEQLARDLADLRSAYAAQALAAMTSKVPEKPATIDRSILTAIDARYPKHAKLARQRLLQWAGQQGREGVEPAQIAAQIADGIADDALEMQAEEV